MKKVKSLYISYDGILEPLGQSQIVSYLKELSKKGIDFILLTYEKKRYLQDKEMLAMVSQELKNHNIKWLNLRYHKNPPFLSTLFDGVTGLILCIYVVIREKPAVVHSRSYISALMGLILKKIFRTKLIFDMRGFWADERVDGGIWKKQSPVYRLVKSLEKIYLKSSDSTVVLSKKARDYINGPLRLNTNVIVIPCAADVEKFKFNSQTYQTLRKKYFLEGKFVFVHAGSLEDWYLIDRMLDFFNVAKENINKAHFLVLTHSPKEKLTKLISARNLSPKDFTVIGILQNEMPDYLSLADAGLFFLKRSFAMTAASPTKVAEYLSCGLPIITNRDIGDLEEYILQNRVGIVINDFEEKEYKAASEGIIDLLAKTGIKENCRKIAIENFSLKSATKKYNELYLRLSNKVCGQDERIKI